MRNSSNKAAQQHQLVLPYIVALGLSCGFGFFVAHESYRQQRWSWNSIKIATKKRVGADPVPWWLLAVGSKGWYPLALWWILKEIVVLEDDTPSRGDDTTGTQTSKQFDVKLNSRDFESLILQGATSSAANAAPEIKSRSASLSSHQPQRQLEILVHNVSHTDLVLSLDTPHINETEKYCMCRPRFSAMDLYTRRILEALPSHPETVSFPRYERSDEDPRHTIVTPRPSRQKQIPTGFRLPSTLNISVDDVADVRIRGRDAHLVDHITNEEAKDLAIRYIFFPLLAALLPKWHQQMAQKHASSSDVKKVLILVSGVGTPRNWTHSITGNSTEICAALMQKFVNLLHPDVTVVRIHSQTNIFRYDENIMFAKRELKPIVDAYRDAHACGKPYPDEIKFPKDLIDTPFSPDWKKTLSLCVSFADGSTARIHAIQAALRPYRPSYFHFWQLKTFWHDTKIVDDDIEMHSFEEMETVPAVEASTVEDEHTRLVIEEMRQYRNDFLEQHSLGDNNSDVVKFWLRKSRKPVLAVLLVQINGQKAPKLYRGTNMEVSMPTGSLCAERNVIGTALADNPGLKRQDLKMVAVLAVPLPKLEHSTSAAMSRNMSFSSIVREGDNPMTAANEDDWVIPTDDLERELRERVTNSSSESSSKPTLDRSPPGTPVLRRIALFPTTSAIDSSLLLLQPQSSGNHHLTSSRPTMGGRRKQKRTVLVHSEHDLNPLLPCGACNEWLKKISESNPHFAVVTFTDAECAGVYVTPCQE